MSSPAQAVTGPAQAVTERLERIRRDWWVFSLWTGLVLCACVSVVALSVLAVIDSLLRLPQRGLGVLFVAWVGLTLGVLAALFVHLWRGRRTLPATARRLEQTFPELESNLINLVQLCERNGEALAGDPFRRAAVAQAVAAVGDFPLHQAALKHDRRRRFALCMQTPRDLLEAAALLALALAFAGALGLVVPAWSSSTGRLLRPWTFVPATGSVKIVQVTPGDTEVLLGSSLEITATLGNTASPVGQAYPATMFVRRGQEPESALPMLPGQGGRTYLAALPQVLGPLQYRIEIGDSQTRRYRVSVYQRPTVAGVTVTYVFPGYLERPAQTVSQAHADLEAPQFAHATLAIRASTPLSRGDVQIAGTRVPGQVTDEGRILRAELLLKETSSYTIHFVTTAGHTDPEPRLNQIRVVPDAPPTVQLVAPARESTIALPSRVPIVVRAGDDHGLGLVRIELKRQGAGEEKRESAVGTLASWDHFPSAGESILHHQLALDSTRFRQGQSLFVRAVARDRRQLDIPGVKLSPQESMTAWHELRMVASEAKAAGELARLDSLRAALWKILQEQLHARLLAAGITRLETAAAVRQTAGLVRGMQVGIQQGAVAVVGSIGPGAEPESLLVKRVVSKLAYEDMLEAVRQAEALDSVKLTADAARPAATLTATQGRIIDVLRRLLSEVRREAADLLAQLKKRPDSTLPPGVQDKLRSLNDKLKDFVKQQKKVIEATENLAKKPVDDFSEKEKQLQKDLASAEDDWSRFLAERHSDLSKLPEQDFANPSLLAELLAVETELKMAKDALTKKTADIAVPLEQLGAEMAQELTTNIEKWLPDTPDRERWSQEEPLTDAMKEAPMAELPRELEDLVGKLMEEEEDLFKEMEDASSSWADSIDKGAGWDAMDGPISNMSAKGVTGNRLPNTSEIGGRSGEGRQGKASGEFVADTAVGKGGRKTPSRLTPDPYVKGQVKDKSKDAVGGATGGGKESGQGGAGLHGPVPDRPDRQLARLASKQAELRNRAEGIDLRYRVLRFHHTDLKRMTEVMAAVEQDLRGGLYRNALRRRDVLLQGLGSLKMYLEGEFLIQQDRTANLPTPIQKEILGSMQETSPAGWEALNRQYFERLVSSQGPIARPAPLPAPTSTPRPARQGRSTEPPGSGR